MDAKIEPIIGRYVHMESQKRTYRVYFEESGTGIPLICMHTAGADARQYRHIMNDPEITRNYRVIAFDMPYHGKSFPPEGFEKEVYKLTTRGLMDLIRNFISALNIERPVFMGCSISGRIILDLAYYHGVEFRSLIGLQCSDHHIPWYDSSWLNRPDISADISAAIVSGMMAPQSPTATVQETLWMYKQSGPGVFKGDLYFYGTEGDFREQASKIKNDVCPIYLLTGEYDYSATTEDTQRVASKINGVYFQVMKELGHFPMSENPKLFRTYILPVLEKILQGGGKLME